MPVAPGAAPGEGPARRPFVQVTEQERGEAPDRLEVAAIPLQEPRADHAAVLERDLGVHEAAGREVELGVDRLGAVHADGRTRARSAVDREVDSRIQRGQREGPPRVARCQAPSLPASPPPTT